MIDEEETFGLKEYLKEIKEGRIFSRRKLTWNEGILIALTIILIITMFIINKRCSCSLDCSLCESCIQKITQRGILG